MCLLNVRVQWSSPWQHASIHPGLVFLLFIPSLYSLFFTCLLHFIGCTLHLFILRGIYCLRVFVVVYILVVFIPCCWNCVIYICELSLLQLLPVIGIFIFKDRLLEAICCCLQTCSVNVVLLVMNIPATTSDISQLWAIY